MRRVFLFLLLLPLIAAPGARAAAQERYYSLLIEGRKAGYGHCVVAPEGSGVKVTSDTMIKVKMLGADFAMRYQAIAVYARPGDPLPLRYTVTLDTNQAKITTDSRFAGRVVRVQSDTNGVKTEKTIPLPVPCYLVEGNLIETWERMGRALRSFKGARTVSIFSPVSGAKLAT